MTFPSIPRSLDWIKPLPEPAPPAWITTLPNLGYALPPKVMSASSSSVNSLNDFLLL